MYIHEVYRGNVKTGHKINCVKSGFSGSQGWYGYLWMDMAFYFLVEMGVERSKVGVKSKNFKL